MWPGNKRLGGPGIHAHGSLSSLTAAMLAVKHGTPGKITRKNLAEQLNEYQRRQGHDWASVQFFGSTSRREEGTWPSTRAGHVFVALLVAAAVTAYVLRYTVLMWLYLGLAAAFLILRRFFPKLLRRKRKGGKLLP